MASRDERALLEVDDQQKKKNPLWKHVVLLERRIHCMCYPVRIIYLTVILYMHMNSVICEHVVYG